MGSKFTLRWRGPDVSRAVARAAVLAIDTTMSAAVLRAKSDHGPSAHEAGRFVTQTGTLERAIRVILPAHITAPGRVLGRWGTQGVQYARGVEEGRPGESRAYPYLRPAASDEYPVLRARMKRAFRRTAPKAI